MRTMIFSKNMDLKHIGPSRKPRKWPFVLLFIVFVIAVLGYMTERDIAAHAEIAKQMECVPEIEMTMPIEERVRA